jgi:polynucleotide 5'-kinase involved in rRNA processing
MFHFMRRFYDWLLGLFWYITTLLSTLRVLPFFPSSFYYLLSFKTRFNVLILRDARATEMDVTIVGLQNAGKTSLLRVLAVSNTDLIFLDLLFWDLC